MVFPVAFIVVIGTLVRWILEDSYEVKAVRWMVWKEAPESSVHGRLLADDGWLMWVVLEKLTADDVVEISLPDVFVKRCCLLLREKVSD